MRRKTLLNLIVSLAGAILLLSYLQIQKAGQARVIVDGTNIKVLRGRVGWARRFGVSQCVTRIAGAALYFDETRSVEKDDLEIPVQVRFQYEPPQRVPAGWPSGDWCSSLSKRVFTIASSRLATADLGEILDRPRDAGVAAAELIGRSLQEDHFHVATLTVRVQLPTMAQSIRPLPEVARRSAKRNPVIFVGLDGADWELLDRYIAAGVMPNLAALVREGHGGVLLTEHPPLSPLLWTTMMTGVSPLEHQILDFTRFHPQSRVKEPITSDERRVPAVWNIATYGGKSVAVLGLWATYPAEPVRGLLVSDRLFTFLYKEATPPPGIVFPMAREKWARQLLQNTENTIGFAQLRHYLPWLREAEYGERVKSQDPYAHPVSALRRILVETSVYHRLATSYLDKHTPDLTIIYLQGTDSIGHVFAPYNPPRQAQVLEDDFERYRGVAERYFRSIDTLLGEYRSLAAQKKGVLMLASDHGFRWFEGRPTQLSSFAAATAAKWHRNEGIYVLWGNGIEPRPRHPSRGGIAQVATTLLSLTGLPSDQRLNGPPLPGVRRVGGQAFDYRAYYQPVRSASAASVGATEEELAKLRALGYIGTAESATAPPTQPPGLTRTAGSYNNEGLILKNQKRTAEAIAAFEKAISIDPNLASALWNLSDILFEGERDPVRSDHLLVRALGNGLPEGVKYVIGRAIGYQRAGRAERSLALLEGAVEVRPRDKELRLFRGRYRIEQRDCAGALEDFRAAQAVAPNDPNAWSSAGLANLCLGRPKEAAADLRHSLAINPAQPQIRRYLATLP